MRVDEDIEQIIRGRAGLTRFAAGSILFRPGERSSRFYLVRSGRVEVTRELEFGDPGTAMVIEAGVLTVIEADRLRELIEFAPGIEAAFVEFASAATLRTALPVPDAFGPLTEDAFEPPPKYAIAHMPVPPLVPGQTSYPPLRSLPGRTGRKRTR